MASIRLFFFTIHPILLILFHHPIADFILLAQCFLIGFSSAFCLINNLP